MLVKENEKKYWLVGSNRLSGRISKFRINFKIERRQSEEVWIGQNSSYSISEINTQNKLSEQK